MTRAASFSTEPIAWQTHVAWFETRLQDANTPVFIAEAAGEPVAQVRYAIAQREATVSISVAPHARRKGYGAQTLRAGSERIFATTSVDVIHAFLKGNNAVSRQLFLGAGFVESEPSEVSGQNAIHLIKTRSR